MQVTWYALARLYRQIHRYNYVEYDLADIKFALLILALLRHKLSVFVVPAIFCNFF